MAMYEHKTTMLGNLFGINPFDQPGVELGKRLARDIMAERRAVSVILMHSRLKGGSAFLQKASLEYIDRKDLLNGRRSPCSSRIGGYPKNIRGVRIDWLVEEPFADIVRHTPLVDETIICNVRKWRRSIFSNKLEKKSSLKKRLQERNMILSLICKV